MNSVRHEFSISKEKKKFLAMIFITLLCAMIYTVGWLVRRGE
jgi:hypothetical protein